MENVVFIQRLKTLCTPAVGPSNASQVKTHPEVFDTELHTLTENSGVSPEGE